MQQYEGANVVTTNPSAHNHGKPAVLTVSHRGSRVVLTHGMRGGNTYAIALGEAEIGRLAAELVGLAPRSALPDVMGAIGALMAQEPPARPSTGPTLVA